MTGFWRPLGCLRARAGVAVLSVGEVRLKESECIGHVGPAKAGAPLAVSRNAAYAVFDGFFQQALIRHLAGSPRAARDLEENVQRVLESLTIRGRPQLPVEGICSPRATAGRYGPAPDSMRYPAAGTVAQRPARMISIIMVPSHFPVGHQAQRRGRKMTWPAWICPGWSRRAMRALVMAAV